MIFFYLKAKQLKVKIMHFVLKQQYQKNIKINLINEMVSLLFFLKKIYSKNIKTSTNKWKCQKT